MGGSGGSLPGDLSSLLAGKTLRKLLVHKGSSALATIHNFVISHNFPCQRPDAALSASV